MSNTFGNIYRLTTFGESHGVAVGGVIDGCPSRLKIDFSAIDTDLARRRGEAALLSSSRALAEKDEVEWLSGLLDGVTLGTPIAFLIRNKAQRSEDYETLKDICRAGHADAAYMDKYGIRDWRGGGRASARETVARVVGGAIAKQILAPQGIKISAEVVRVGTMATDDKNALAAYLKSVKVADDSVGGVVECRISGLSKGLGEPVFDKLQARLASAVMSIPAAKGFEYGEGFRAAQMLGSEHNKLDDGISGGISTGGDIVFRVAFKPTPSIGIGGRHDVCVALRAPVIVEAMAAMTIVDSNL